MGIRFYCPNGHKLNVKEFQAGKRGICPHCGARIQIPTKSVRERPGKGAKAATTAAEANEGASVANSVETEPPGPSDRVGDSGEVLPLENMAGQPSAGATPPAPEGFPDVAAPVCAGPIAADAAPTPPPATDPLAEAGAKVWYVRLAAGGQFGPAGSNVMRTWLDEDRVAADSLVWREGWPDWQPAGDVFPQLAAGRPGGNLPKIAVAETSVAAATAHRAGPARKPRSRQTMLITGLVVVVLALLLVLILVVTGAVGAETATGSWRGSPEGAARPGSRETFVAASTRGARSVRPQPPGAPATPWFE